jgi:hypothetical protein
MFQFHSLLPPKPLNKQFAPLGLEYSMELGDTSITETSVTSPTARNSNWLEFFRNIQSLINVHRGNDFTAPRWHKHSKPNTYA